MKFQLSIVLLVLLIPALSSAQDVKAMLDGVLKAKVRDNGVIIKQNEVKGYYTFYEIDKVDRKTREYLLKIIDQNLEPINETKITDPKDVMLYEGSYNGDMLLFKFVDIKNKKLIYRKFDNSGELVGTETVLLDKKRDLWQYYVKDEDDIQGTSLFSIPGYGFADYTMINNKKIGYSIKFFPNNKSRSWKSESPVTAKLNENALYLGHTDDVLFSSIITYKNARSTSAEMSLIGLDLSTGKKVFENPLITEKYVLNPMNAYTEEANQSIYIFGLYYALGSSIIKDKSRGLYMQEYDSKGEKKNEGFISWGGDVSKFLPSNQKGKIEDFGYVHFHKMLKTSDGKTYAIGEQFRKAVSALGIAAAIMGGGDIALSKVVIEDIVIFEFSESFELSGVQIFEKDKSSVELPSGYGIVNAPLLAKVIDSWGAFDYEFTQVNENDKVWTVAYRDVEDIKGERNKHILGSISHDGNEYFTDDIPLETDAKWIRVLPAKPGYVLLMEYFKKEKKLELRLERFKY